VNYQTVPYTTHLAATAATLADPGGLLITAGRDGRPNVMTIGWGTAGTIWDRPVFVVLVRPSRHTYTLLDESSAFVVGVPPHSWRETVDYVGKVSGRDHDKFAERGLESIPSLSVATPGIAGCPVLYECQVVHANDLIPDNLVPPLKEAYYARGDYHRVFFGEILTVRALPNAAELLGK
jgi:flavin reductase (DIM6/NTAB) family NADH-FMN oxidoreductase RutF